MNSQTKGSSSERGIALVIALIAVLVLGVLATAVMFSSQTQTWASLNYRLATQSRYAAEAGLQTTMNWLSNDYTAPASFGSYNTNANPVQYSSHPVVLSGMSGVSSNYPDSTVASAYNTALSNQSVPGLANATFSTYATLLRMTPSVGVSWLSGSGGVIQTWQITSVGNIGGSRNAAVQVVGTYERAGTPIFHYGVVGLGSTCGDVTFSNGTMDAWNSSNGTYAATHQNTGGDLATNGNVTLSGGSTFIHGTISDSTNDTVGNCPDGITNNVGGTPWNALDPIGTMTSLTPVAPSPMTSNTNINANSNTCWSGSPSGCTVIAGPAVTIAPGTYGNLTSNSNLHLSAGTYNFNSVNLNGGSLTLDSYPVVINLGGNGINGGGTLFASQSSTTINDGGIPSNLQIVSAAGAGLSSPPVITMNASSSMYAVVYAPNAYVHITGSSQFLGAVVGQQVTSDSSGGFHYDLSLQNSLVTSGHFRPLGFSWSKF